MEILSEAGVNELWGYLEHLFTSYSGFWNLSAVHILSFIFRSHFLSQRCFLCFVLFFKKKIFTTVS